MIYLASPYSHSSLAVREARYYLACVATTILMKNGEHVFSPVVHGHPLSGLGLRTDWGFWEPYDREYLKRCDELIVLALEGWQHSVGVRAEIAIAEERGIPVRFLDLTLCPTTSPTLAHAATEDEG